MKISRDDLIVIVTITVLCIIVAFFTLLTLQKADYCLRTTGMLECTVVAGPNLVIVTATSGSR